MAQRLSETVTVRLSAKAMQKLRAQAKREKKSLSDVLREQIEGSLSDASGTVTAYDLSRAWVGAIQDRSLPAGSGAREAMQDWSPDRR